MIFKGLLYCHFPSPSTSIRGKETSNLVHLLFEYLSFSKKREATIFFPRPLTFLQWPIHLRTSSVRVKKVTFSVTTLRPLSHGGDKDGAGIWIDPGRRENRLLRRRDIKGRDERF